jgi:ABC-type sugar transport system permease subunit
MKHNKLAYLFLLPTVLILVVFLVSPMFTGIYFSFQKLSLQGISEFVGFQNYLLLLKENRFLGNLLLTLVYIAGNLFLSLPLAYAAALFVTKRLRGTLLFRAFFLLPWIVAPIVSAVLFRSLVDPTIGPIAQLLETISGKSTVILADTTLALLVIILHSCWRSFPFMMLFLVAGMMTIPNEVYEAAQMDGANSWERFWHITIPLTKVHLIIVLLIISLWTMQDVEGVYALTQGGPGYATEVTAVRLFKEAFINFDLNIASTIGVFLLAIGIIAMTFYLKIVGRGRTEEMNV